MDEVQAIMQYAQIMQGFGADGAVALKTDVLPDYLAEKLGEDIRQAILTVQASGWFWQSVPGLGESEFRYYAHEALTRTPGLNSLIFYQWHEPGLGHAVLAHGAVILTPDGGG